MKKMITCIGAIMLLALVLTGCCLSHDWQAATCDAPKTCAKCGETEGEKLGHDWVDATCDAPKTCSVCGLTEGEKLEHVWSEETCAHAQICNLCGAEGNAPLEHEPGDWVVVEEATTTKTGMKEKYCEACGEKLEELEYIIPKGELPADSILYDESGNRITAGAFAEVYTVRTSELRYEYDGRDAYFELAEEFEGEAAYTLGFENSSGSTLMLLQTTADKDIAKPGDKFGRIVMIALVEWGNDEELLDFIYFYSTMIHLIDPSIGEFQDCIDLGGEMVGRMTEDKDAVEEINGVKYTLGYTISGDFIMMTFSVDP